MPRIDPDKDEAANRPKAALIATCSLCGIRLSIPVSKVGYRIRCPKCKGSFRVKGAPSSERGNETVGVLDEPSPATEPSSGDTADLQKGDIFADRFEIIHLLGGGTFGTVYRAFDRKDYCEVALKIPSNDILFNDQFRKRFRAEAEILGRMRHPNIVTFYDAQFDVPPRFLVAEFVKGHDLEKTFIRARKSGDWIDLPYALWIVAKLAIALHHAHLKGVIHRDVKPANILIKGETVKLTDFGLARSVDSDLTQAGLKIGTPFYMSPEQVSGVPARVDEKADQYGLGVVLYELLCRRRPFEGRTIESVYHKILNNTLLSPTERDPAIPRELSEVCLKALAKDPAARWPDCAAFASALRPWVPEDSVVINPPPANGPPRLKRQSPAPRFVPEERSNASELGRTKSPVSNGVPAPGRTYHQALEAAHAAWRQHRRRDACSQLDRCNPEERGWEWAYLQALCRSPITNYSDNAGEIGALAFDRAGRFLAVAEEGNVRVWDTSTQRLVCWLMTHLKRIDAVAFSPNGSWLAWAGGESIRITDLRAPFPEQATRVLPGHGAKVTGLAFASDGIHLASASLDQSVRIWNVLERLERLELQGRAGPVRTLAFHPHDPNLLVCAHIDGTVVLWDWLENRERRRGSMRSNAGIDVLAIHPQGRIFATGGCDGRLTFWDLESLEPIATVPAHQNAVSSLDFHPNGRWLASLSGGKERSIRLGASDPGLAATELGRKVGAVPFGTSFVHALTFSPVDDGRMALALGRDKTVKMWDGTSFWNSLASGGRGDRIRAATIHPGGRQVAVARRDGAIEVRDLAGTTPPRVFSGRGVAIRALTFQPGLLHLVAGGDDGALTFWDLTAGSRAERLQAHPREVLDLTFDRDGRFLATAGADGTVRVWGAHRHERIRTLAGHGENMATSVAFAYEGGELCLYSGGADRLIHAWDLRTGDRLATLEGHRHRVISLAPSADGRQLVSLGADRTLMVWALDRREPVLVLRDVDILGDLAWHREASVIAAVGEDRSLILETLPPPRGEED
jgi:WD40 repeat protein/serine/threonine protein kinase